MSQDDSIAPFVERCVRFGKVWGIKDPDGWAVLRSHLTLGDTLPFWSREDLARDCTIDEWSKFDPVEISLSYFQSKVLPALKENRAMVGLDWLPQMVGQEYTPSDVAAAFNE